MVSIDAHSKVRSIFNVPYIPSRSNNTLISFLTASRYLNEQHPLKQLQRWNPAHYPEILAQIKEGGFPKQQGLYCSPNSQHLHRGLLANDLDCHSRIILSILTFQYLPINTRTKLLYDAIPATDKIIAEYVRRRISEYHNTMASTDSASEILLTHLPRGNSPPRSRESPIVPTKCPMSSGFC